MAERKFQNIAKTSVYKRIGNAVPSKLASVVAKTVLSFIDE